jgi:hypothetical protein
LGNEKLPNQGAILKTRNSGILLFSALFFLIFFPTAVMGQSSGGMNTAKGSIGRKEPYIFGELFLRAEITGKDDGGTFSTKYYGWNNKL